MPLETQEPQIMPSTIETIDTGLYNYINEKFNISAETNDGWKKIPVLWLSSERAFQVKNDKNLRDSAGRLVLPLITIERTSMTKDPAFKGAVQANVMPEIFGPRGYRGGALPIARRIKQDKTRDRADADQKRTHGPIDAPSVARGFTKSNRKIVYEEILMPIPTYVSVTYSINLRAEYQQQMNTMMTPFITRTGQINSFVFTENNHRYEAFIQQDLSQNNNLSNMGEEERTFMTKIDIKVLGYLIGDGKNNSQPASVKKETIVEIKPIRERVILGDKKPWVSDNDDYRQ